MVSYSSLLLRWCLRPRSDLERVRPCDGRPEPDPL